MTKKETRVKNPRIATPLRKPPRLEGVVENVGIKPKRKKKRSELQKRMAQLKEKEKKAMEHSIPLSAPRTQGQPCLFCRRFLREG